MIRINNNNLERLAREHANYYKEIVRPELINITDKKLRAFIEIYFDKLFDAKPDEIRNIIRHFLKLRINFGGRENTLRDNVKSVFNYDKFFSKNDTDKGAYALAKILKVDVCPFCNRQYTFTVGKRGSGVRHDFDHYYPQKLYPFLALSFYNLVPICETCNGLKSSKDTYKEPILHPYKNTNDSLNFEWNFKDESKKKYIESLYGTKHQDVIIGTNGKCEHSKKSIKVLKLDYLYAEHTDYAHEIIKKAYIYNDSRLTELYETFPQLFSSKEEVKRIAFGNYTQQEDLGKRPLAKLTADLTNELENL